jgi:4-diphosphocytidyl-2-C-methyl-D-erythritol kinase
MLQLKAPAKLNLFLHVTGQREDGYHLLQSLFVPINWFDEIEIIRTNNGSIERCSAHPWDAEDDICIKAARHLKAIAVSKGLMPSSWGCEITIHKSIPHGAGLGGGSSDAAACLKGLQELWKLELGPQELTEIGLKVGADVPFFLRSGPALVTGIGETLQSQVLKTKHFVVAVPHVEVPTALIFRNERLQRNNPAISEDDLKVAFNQSIWTLGRNDLSHVAFTLFPDLHRGIGLLRRAANQQGLPQETVRMSGSGSALFCSCETKAQATSLLRWLESQAESSHQFRSRRAVQAYL